MKEVTETLSMLEESPVTVFLQTLWKCKAVGVEDINIGVHVPHTVIYEHNFPKGLFHTTPGGMLQRRVGKEIDSKTIVDEFVSTSARRKQRNEGGGKSPPSSNSPRKLIVGHSSHLAKSGSADIVAVYIEKGVELGGFAVQFLTLDGLRMFLFGASMNDDQHGGGNERTATNDYLDHDAEYVKSQLIHDVRISSNKNGILQQFMYPSGDHSEQIQVVWTSHLCIAEKSRNSTNLFDTGKTPFQRGATFEGPPNFCERAYLAPKLVEKIRTKCESLAEKIFAVTHRPVERMTLYFATDASETLWLLRCQFLRLSSPSLSNLRRPLSAAFDLHSSASKDRPASATTGGDSRKVHRGTYVRSDILPEYVIPECYRGSLLNESAPTAENRDRKSEILCVTMNSSLLTLTEDAVLSCGMQQQGSSSNNKSRQEKKGAKSFEQPRIDLKCMDQRPNRSQVAMPFKSRLCPKMSWLEGRGVTLQRPKTHYERRGYESSVNSRKSTKSLPPLEDPRRSLGAKSLKSTTTVDGSLKSPKPTIGYKKIVYTMTTPSLDEPAAGVSAPILGGRKQHPLMIMMSRLPTEAEVVKQLTQRPPHPLLLPTTAEVEESADSAWYYTQRMQKTKDSIELAVSLLETLRSSAFTHFLLYENSPLPISVPIFMFSCDVVQFAVVNFLTKSLPKVSMAEAVELDFAVDRRGIVDDWAYHHQYVRTCRGSAAAAAATAQRGVSELPCFAIESLHATSSLASKLAPFFLVDLRNAHADMEFSLITARQAVVLQRAEERDRQIRRDLRLARTPRSPSRTPSAAPPQQTFLGV